MDAGRIRKDFPLFDHDEEKLVYMDSACQSLRPRSVIQSMMEYYTSYPACAGRSIHRLASQVSIKLDEAREDMARFLGAESPNEIVFTKNCTESMNMIARGLNLRKGDVVLTSDIEHNSNHVPWLEIAKEVGIERRICPSTPKGEFDLEAFKSLMDKKVKVVSIVHTNNVNGATVPMRDISQIAHDKGALVAVDGAQSAPHMKVDVERMGIDLFGLSLHKMLGPSGVGALYGRAEVLGSLRPLMSGGGSVVETSYDAAKYLPLPERLEAGLLNYAGIIGAGAAVRYLEGIGMDAVEEHDHRLNRIITEGLRDIPEIDLLRPHDPERRGSIFSFNVHGMKSHDVALILDEMSGIMIRSGMHCVHPYFKKIGVDGCARASVYVYNTDEDCARFVTSVKKLVETFSS